MPYSTLYRWFKKFSQESVKDSLIQEDPGLQLPNLELIKWSPLLKKMSASLSDSKHKWCSIRFCPLYSEKKSYSYEDWNVFWVEGIFLDITRQKKSNIY